MSNSSSELMNSSGRSEGAVMLPKPVKPVLINDVRSEINVTPLVDVCLVLLIIFMVVAPILHAGVKVELPQTVNGHSLPESNQLTVSVAADGGVYVRNARVSGVALPALLAQ